jgi:hypothetical protein
VNIWERYEADGIRVGRDTWARDREGEAGMTTMNVGIAIVLSHLLGMAVMLGLLHVRRWWRRLNLRPRQMPLGFSPVTVPARTDLAPGKVAEEGKDFMRLVSRPQELFRPYRILFPKNVDGIEILDFKIGARSQFANAAPVAASALQDSSDTRFAVAQIAQDVVFEVRNLTDTPKEFSVTLLGEVYERYEDALL